jgi:hypothetical protein
MKLLLVGLGGIALGVIAAIGYFVYKFKDLYR